MSLAERLVAIHTDLGAAGVDHAFGGAIALAYWTLDPRGTTDIDMNIFVAASNCEPAVAALPGDIDRGDDAVAAIRRDGQIRLWWGETPIDLFFDYRDIHFAAARNRRVVPFADTPIPILGPVELATFKAMAAKTRDWADIEAMLVAETLDLDAVRGHLIAMVGAADPRLARLDEAVRLAGEAAE